MVENRETHLAAGHAASRAETEVRSFWRLRRVRHLHKMTLAQLAEKTDLTKSYLSKIERGTAVPSLTVAMKIADVFGIGVGELLGERTADPTATIVRKSDRKRFDLGAGQGISQWEAITTLSVEGAVEVFVVHPPRKGTPDDLSRVASAHRGQELLFVLKGKVEITVDHAVIAVLDPGDSLTFDGYHPHRVRTVGATAAEVLMMITKPDA